MTDTLVPEAEALDRSVVPAVWARYTDLLIERGEDRG